MMPEVPRVGEILHGFQVTAVTPLSEINITLVELHHLKTGARLAHLANDDPNNLFAIGLRTTPSDSTGIAHILEHTVLCGSRRYPVRDPFFSMLRRSLNTFMNALTASDWTLYPFSSMNEKDFYNLMGIYLDAVFFPLLSEMNFRQEGHRLEFSDPEDPASSLEFKGVVYNEMKGAMADPSSLIGRRLNRHLFPTTTYHHNSGGDPADILDLTHQALKDFHSSYYHPSNAWFFTYGNLPLVQHLKTIEAQALREFEARAVNSEVPPEKRYDAPRRVEETFPLSPDETASRRSMVQTAWLTCDISDGFERTALDLLSVLLLGNPAAPLHKALLDSRLGSNLVPGSGFHDDYRTTLFAAGLQGTDPEHTEAIETLILDTLHEVAAKGFSRERIEGAIHRYEFGHREVTGDSYPYALLLCMRMIGPWMHCGDAVSGLQISEHLERLRKELDAGPFFENLIRRRLLDNPHRVTLTLRPDPQQKEREDQKMAERLHGIRSALTPSQERQLVEQARTLKQIQEAQEDLSSLPTLELSDIPVDEPEVAALIGEEQDVPVFWFDQPTNGIGYVVAHLDASQLESRHLAYLPLFCSLLTQIGAAGLNYLEMAERIEACTGGIAASTEILDSPADPLRFQALVQIRGKALARNQDKLFAILSDIFTAPDFSDRERLRTVLGQVRTTLENSIPSAGHSYAARAAAANLTPAARLRETWSGLELVALAKKTAELDESALADFANQMQEIASQLLRRNSLSCAVVTEQQHFAQVRPELGKFLAGIPQGQAPGAQGAEFVPKAAQLGWATSVPVSYVTRVFATVPYAHVDSGGLMVLGKLLKAGFLHREIREKGGAYGGMASANPETGLLSLLSYRDPHLVRTLKIYDEAARWAAAGQFTDQDIKEAILAVFAEIDKPLSPGGRGFREFANIRQGLSREMRQSFRGKILATDRKTLQRLAQDYLITRRSQSAVSVVSGEDLLKKANAELGEERLEIRRI